MQNEFRFLLNSIKKELVTAEGRYQTPMLIDQLQYLSGMLGRADQAPGKDAYERFETLKAKFESLQRQMEQGQNRD